MANAHIPVQVTLDPVFSRIYQNQRNIQAGIADGVAPADRPDHERMAFITEMSTGLVSEVHEALAETGWKSWATSNHIHHDAYRDELADTYLFLMNMMLAADITMVEFVKAIEAKQAKMVKRMADGYDGLNKCPECRRAYDDPAVECTPVDVGNPNDPDAGDPQPAWCQVYGHLNPPPVPSRVILNGATGRAYVPPTLPNPAEYMRGRGA